MALSVLIRILLQGYPPPSFLTMFLVFRKTGPKELSGDPNNGFNGADNFGLIYEKILMESTF